MASVKQSLTIYVLALTVLTGSLVSFSKSVIAGEFLLDDRCRPNSRLPESDAAFLSYQWEFKANRQTYWFLAARYQDGAYLLCFSKPNFKEPQPLKVSQLQNQFIRKIVKAPNSNTVFVVTVAEGNGSRVPLTEYQLNLSNPNQPSVTRLRRK
jgi:hypothetical protein